MSGLTDEEKMTAERCFGFMKSIEKSPSHGIDHSSATLRYALELLKNHPANRKAVICAAILHDASRHIGARGEKQGKESAEMICDFLRKLDLSAADRRLVSEAVENHSVLEQSREISVESKIIHDADKLAGLGILGLLRISIYAGEKGLGIDYVKKKLFWDMQKRVNNLHFEESKGKAAQLNKELAPMLSALKTL